MDRRYGLTDEQRFLAYVQQSNRCWEWTGYKNAKGYGVMNIRGKRVLAHRFAYERIAEVPDGMCVLHHCDNPACVRFKHLFLGTKADNNADMTEKGRRAPMPHLQGTRNHAARLTEDAVRTIRQSTESGPVLATRYGVTRVTISAIRRRLIWNHLE
jgi:hypothetical protein